MKISYEPSYCNCKKREEGERNGLLPVMLLVIAVAVQLLTTILASCQAFIWCVWVFGSSRSNEENYQYLVFGINKRLR